MRCQDVERLILEENAPSAEARAEVDAHLAECARCSAWREFRQALRERAAEAGTPELSPGLAERVRQAAKEELAHRSDGLAGRARANAGPGVPGFIWAAFTAITVLTAGFLIPAAHEFIERQKLTLGTALALVLILQNALTLFFAPVVLRRARQL